MELLPINEVRIKENRLAEINQLMCLIYRLILYSRHHDDNDLLNNYLAGLHNLQELLSLKNAQMGVKRITEQ